MVKNAILPQFLHDVCDEDNDYVMRIMMYMYVMRTDDVCDEAQKV